MAGKITNQLQEKDMIIKILEVEIETKKEKFEHKVLNKIATRSLRTLSKVKGLTLTRVVQDSTEKVLKKGQTSKYLKTITRVMQTPS